MPTYQYQCRNCGHAFEQFQKFSDDPLTVCPECEGPVQRVIQNVGVVFKGSGWYINDSRKSNSSNSSSEKSTSTESSESTTKIDKTDKNETKSASDKTPAAASASTKSD